MSLSMLATSTPPPICTGLVPPRVAVLPVPWLSVWENMSAKVMLSPL